MYGYTMSTPVDRTYRFSRRIDITARDEGASVWYWGRKGRRFVGTIIRGVLIRPGQWPAR